MGARRSSAARSGPWAAVAGLGLCLLAAAVLFLGLTPPFVMALLAGVGALSLLALRQRLHRERTEHAAALARRDAADAVTAERLRLARDLHDIVSHGLGMITVRVATASHLHGRQPDGQALLSALQDVEVISRTATLELRRMLEALRDEADDAARHPAETLDCLPEILDGAERAGLTVEVHRDDLGEVSPGAQVAICRVIREGLANCARHAGSTSVRVTLIRAGAQICVTVDDEGPQRGWTARPGAGRGLLGLRERVSSLGGTLVAGPRPPDEGRQPGFSLQATIPEPVA